MGLRSILIANRGEIAVRIIRAAADLGIRTVAVYSGDDAASLHVRRADEARPLEGTGVKAYLDAEQLLAVARAAGCDSIHPGYGFLSESATFARRCAAEGLTFVGPRPDLLELFGDKAEARAFAKRCNIPVLPGTLGPTTMSEALDFLDRIGEGGAVMIKAIAGGGGRGMRAVYEETHLAEAYERCQAEALAAFGRGDLFVEALLPRARHVEVQVLGDGSGAVAHLGERDCSIQRRHQKLVEIAPSPGLSPIVRDNLIAAAVYLAKAVRYENLGTFEFLVASSIDRDDQFFFLEANPRLQVEHTVTEEVTGVDLVEAQLRLAAGITLADLGLSERQPQVRGFALQARINLESMLPDGSVQPAAGIVTTFELPSGPGIRVDTSGYVGYATNPHFDSLLAKLVAFSPSQDFRAVVARAYRALCECRLEGVATNVLFLQNLLQHPDFASGNLYTRFIDERLAALLSPESTHRRLFFPAGTSLAGVRVDPNDPLAVLNHGKLPSNGEHVLGAAPSPGPMQGCDQPAAPNEEALRSPMPGTIVSLDVREGDLVRPGQPLLVIESMKMQHVIRAEKGGLIKLLAVSQGDAVFAGHPILFFEPAQVAAVADAGGEAVDLDRVRPDLAEVQDRHALGLDDARPDAVASRRKTGQRTARENIADLCDPGSFIEYGPLAIASQRQRRTLDDLIRRTPADGLVAGIGRVNGHLFDEVKSRCAVISYDYTVLAGTQGYQNHRKKDRLFELAEQYRLPVVLFTEGGGGRPGDTEGFGVAGLDCLAFNYWGRLSGLVPLVGVNSGRCFAGNAALLGCCDVVVATSRSNIGMGGPAMIEGGGLGVFRPEEIGPMEVQVPNGVVDIPVDDDAQAVDVAKQYLSYFQGPLPQWQCADQRLLRAAIPENRLRVYDVRSVVETLADAGSVLELRRHFGHGMVTALIRIEGRPLGLIANNPVHLAGAIDRDGADKAARFMQLCDAFDLPILTLCDTPGIMVGPESEKTALVRHAARLFVTGASLTVPFFTIVLRKGYGLGAQAMAGGSFRAPFFTVAWPTGEFGGMGLEGAVKLGYRKELAALEDPAARKALYEQMVAKMYEIGKATHTATHLEIDDVIDPAESRRWITTGLRSAPTPTPRAGKKRPCVDTW